MSYTKSNLLSYFESLATFVSAPYKEGRQLNESKGTNKKENVMLLLTSDLSGQTRSMLTHTSRLISSFKQQQQHTRYSLSLLKWLTFEPAL